MSIADKITQLTTIRGDIRTALAGKGVSASDHDFSDFAGDISSISTGGLPNEYEAVDYIESSGTQYINTEIVPTDDVAVEIVMIQNNDYGSIFRGLSVYQNGQRCYIPSFWKDGYTTKWGLCYGTIDNNYAFGYSMATGNLYKAKARYTTSSQSTTLVNSPTTATQSISTSISITKPMYLFANNGTNGAEVFLNQKLFSLKVWLNGNLTADFVPCYRKSDKVIGLYDTARSKFYTNAGTGSFTCYPAPPST